VDKEEVVQALQEAAVQPQGRHAKPVGIPCLLEVGRRVLGEEQRMSTFFLQLIKKKKATYAESMSEMKSADNLPRKHQKL